MPSRKCLRHPKVAGSSPAPGTKTRFKRAFDGPRLSPAIMEDWPKPGTPVKLVVKTWSGKAEHTGIALPGSGKNLVTMKLQNGYNVSFPESYVDSFEVLHEMPVI